MSVPAGNTYVKVIARQSIQDWYSADLHQRERVVSRGTSFATPQDQANYEANKASFDKHVGGRALNPTEPKTLKSDKVSSRDPKGRNPLPAWWNSQVSSPQNLLADIAQIQGPLSQTSAFSFFGELGLVMTSAISPQFRSMAFAALKYVPGVTVIGNQTDQLGRSGTEISFTPPGPEQQDLDTETLIVSPRTGEVLESHGTERIAVRGLPVGTPNWLDVYVQQGFVESDKALPRGGTQPLSASVTKPYPTRPVKPISPFTAAFGVRTATSTAPATTTAIPLAPTTVTSGVTTTSPPPFTIVPSR